LPPAIVARDALARLENEPEDGVVLSVVTQILRRYLGERFDLPNGEMTTAEFFSALARCQKMDPALGEAVSSFLRECDVRKFSPTNNAAQINAVKRALEIIELVEKKNASQSLLTSAATTKSP
jgi:hypothetical protein